MNVFQRKNVFFICCLISSESKCSIQFSRFQLDFFFAVISSLMIRIFLLPIWFCYLLKPRRQKQAWNSLSCYNIFVWWRRRKEKRKKNLNWKIYDEGKGRQRQRKFEWDNWGEEIFCLLAKITRNWQENSVSLNRLIFHRWNLM